MIILHPEKYRPFEGSGIFFGRDGEAILSAGFPVLGPEANRAVVKAK
ncbi:Uncharacterised protein [Yersinia enterocolitica]|nr:hypothetical protein CH47_2618 [Yersinia enterocolitica]KGA72820.1 hypothetical protein DJ59_3986 [Yersinia enterocolitica]VFS99530.1 Uncharacterised protein [Yersinia enterocolitica]VTP89705.1 Uncharacterised protein [Yersinia enterocolitica subsp. enterocolitica]